MRITLPLAAAALAVGLSSPPPALAAPLGHLAGEVSDPGHHPIAGATVALRGPTPRRLLTDAAGRFDVDVAPGAYVVAVSRSGFAATSAQVTVSAGATATVRLTLAPPPAPPKPAKEPVAATRAAGDTKASKKDVSWSMAASESVGRGYVAPAPMAPAALGAGAPSSGYAVRSRLAGAPARAPMVIVDKREQGGNTEAYAHHDDNPFQVAQRAPLSTFSIDVDTASYTNTRRFLRDSTLPPKDAVRVEEFINYFRYDDPAPTGDAPVAINAEVGPSPWNPAYRMLRVGLRAPQIPDAQVPARNLVFLLDVSGSMMSPDKLPLLKRGMGLLVDQLRPQDRVAIAVYAGASGVALPSTPGTRKDEIRAAIERLEAGGSTNGAAGIKLAYQLAQGSFQQGGINRVILCTDGDFNVGTTSEGELVRLIEAEREHGVFLTVLGFGTGNVKDATMEKLADKGNGNYAYVDSLDEARKVLVKEAGATLVTVAKDVKLQLEFNPAVVAGYRLIGYEDRMLADQDFNDDKKDAGELGAGHSVTALYEVVPVGVPVPAAKVDALKYQTPAAATGGSRELATIKLRYKAPTGGASRLLSRPVTDGGARLEATSADFRWSAAVAGFGMLLRGSAERGALSWKLVEGLAKGAVGQDGEGYRREFLLLLARAAGLGRA